VPPSPRRALTRLRAFIDTWALKRANTRPERNPKIIAILFCIGLNLIPTALGLQALPGSLEPTPFFGRVATGFAVLGCFMCVIGLVTPAKWRDIGLAVEIAGTVFLFTGFGFYSIALYQHTVPAQRAFAFGQSFGISIGSLLRTAQIALYVRGRRLADKEPTREIS
jgi:hypothetical protein